MSWRTATLVALGLVLGTATVLAWMALIGLVTAVTWWLH